MLSGTEKKKRVAGKRKQQRAQRRSKRRDDPNKTPNAHLDVHHVVKIFGIHRMDVTKSVVVYTHVWAPTRRRAVLSDAVLRLTRMFLDWDSYLYHQIVVEQQYDGMHDERLFWLQVRAGLRSPVPSRLRPYHIGANKSKGNAYLSFMEEEYLGECFVPRKLWSKTFAVSLTGRDVTVLVPRFVPPKAPTTIENPQGLDGSIRLESNHEGVVSGIRV